jgi:hypothetical protein
MMTPFGLRSGGLRGVLAGPSALRHLRGGAKTFDARRAAEGSQIRSVSHYERRHHE